MKALANVRSFSELTHPPGFWQELYDGVETRGVKYRLENLLAYAKGVKTALESGQPFGIRLVHDPANEHDPLAIKVVGFWLTSGWFRRTEHEQHLGFLPYRMAYALHHGHKDKTVRARLVDLELDIDEPVVLIDVLYEV